MACENLATRRLREFHAAVSRTEGCKARDGRAATTGVGRHHIMKYRKETGGMAKTGPKVVRPVKQKTLRKTSARKAKPEPTPKEVEEHNNHTYLMPRAARLEQRRMLIDNVKTLWQVLRNTIG